MEMYSSEKASLGLGVEMCPSGRRNVSSRRLKRFLSVGGLCLLLALVGVRTWAPNRNGVHPHGVADYRSMDPGSFEWWSCVEEAREDGAECGYIIVPTDYFNASAGVTKLALSRYKATKQPRLGMVLMNAGGPGGSTKQMVLAAGKYLRILFGEQYDVVGFDPRGIGETEPQTQCFIQGTLVPFLYNTVLHRGFDVGGNLTDESLRNSLLKDQAEADALLQTIFTVCGETMGEQLRYMGTSSVVRDIDFMSKVMEGEEALINFYGPSYGSILGQYLVNMLPDRIGRVVIDGIADAVAWSNEPNYKWYRSWLSSTEKAYDVYLEACVRAGPSACALAEKDNEDASEIRNRIEVFFDDLLVKPLAVPDPSNPTIITAGRARDYLFQTLQLPRIWQARTRALSSAMHGDGTAMMSKNFDPWGSIPDIPSLSEDLSSASLNSRRHVAPKPHGDFTRQAVSCNDAVPIKPADAASREDIIDEYIGTLQTVTKFAMSVVTTEPDSGCQYWPVSPPERFSGPWNHTLRNPILIHSNTADPVTPISSGELVKKLLGDSARLAIQDGPGHTTFFLGSLCTASITQAFFVNGTLPEEGHVCQVDEAVFPSGNISRIFSAEQEALLEAISAVGDALVGVGRPPFM